MTVIKKQVNLQEESNRIQAEANRIQKEMVGVIKKYDKTTSRHNLLMAFLTVVIIFLSVATLWCNKTGRYAISEGKGGMYVLDTKTSQLWARASGGRMNLYIGTNETPKTMIIKPQDDPNNK